jgi:hypothetical protein
LYFQPPEQILVVEATQSIVFAVLAIPD